MQLVVMSRAIESLVAIQSEAFNNFVVVVQRLTMNDRVNLTEAEMSEFDAESGSRRGNSGNDDEQDGVKYSW